LRQKTTDYLRTASPSDITAATASAESLTLCEQG